MVVPKLSSDLLEQIRVQGYFYLLHDGRSYEFSSMLRTVKSIFFNRTFHWKKACCSLCSNAKSFYTSNTKDTFYHLARHFRIELRPSKSVNYPRDTPIAQRQPVSSVRSPIVKQTLKPTVESTVKPTVKPIMKPTVKPTVEPTVEPTDQFLTPLKVSVCVLHSV